MPIRITDGSIATQVLTNLQGNLRNLADIQQRVSTGLRFSKPSDNPTDLITALGFRNDLQSIRRFGRNIDRGLSQLNVTDTSLGTVGDIIQRARQLAVNANDGALSETDRVAIADELRELLNSTVESGNSALNGLFIYAGDRTQTTPFEVGDSGSGSYVRYLGDTGLRQYEIAKGVAVPVNIHGLEAFFAQSNVVNAGVTVADPTDVLVNQLPAAPPPSNGDFTGDFTINGATVTVTASDTLNSLAEKINQADADVIAEVDASGKLVLTSTRSEDFQLADGTSNIMSALGMFEQVDGGVLEPGGTLIGTTTLASLGITPAAIRINNGGTITEIDLSAALTIDDVLAAVNSSGAGATAYINDAGTGLVFSATSTTDEFEVLDTRRVFGGNLGAPVDPATTLASLGIGPLTSINIDVGGDSRTIDLSAASTVGDVLDAINAGHPLANATINSAGNGIDIGLQDYEPLGLQDITISEVGAGTSAADLGILGSSTLDSATDLGVAGQGTVDEVGSRNVFKTLMDLENALRNGGGTTEEIDTAIEDFDAEFTHLLTLRTRTGARVNRFEETQSRYAREEVFLTELMSANEDVDLAEVVTDLRLQETTLQAALAASSRVISPSLLDFLG